MQVLIAGSREQVQSSIEAAEPLKSDLLDRGIFIIPLPIFSSGESGASAPAPLQGGNAGEDSAEAKAEALK